MTNPTHFTDAKWVAQLTADQEREAVAWLDEIAPHVKCRSDPLGQRGTAHAATLKSMLSRPILPQEPMGVGFIKEHVGTERYTMGIGRYHRALYAHLTKPKKMKPVFHVTGSDNKRHSDSTTIDADWHDINQAITALCNDGYQVVTVRREMVPE